MPFFPSQARGKASISGPIDDKRLSHVPEISVVSYTRHSILALPVPTLGSLSSRAKNSKAAKSHIYPS